MDLKTCCIGFVAGAYLLYLVVSKPVRADSMVVGGRPQRFYDNARRHQTGMLNIPNDVSSVQPSA